MDAALAGRCAELNTAIDCLSLTLAHDALTLFTASVRPPKTTDILRCSPCTGHHSLQQFDNLPRRGIRVICNRCYLQARPVQSPTAAEDRLGVYRVVSPALSAKAKHVSI